jgi:hypothetical protein
MVHLPEEESDAMKQAFASLDAATPKNLREGLGF